MSVDGESDPYVSHNDEDCIVCRDIEIAWLEDKVALIKGLEAERDAVDSICEADGRLNSDTQFVLAVRQTIRRAGTKG